MIKHIWSVVCKESKIEMETNNITLIDAYENLQFNLQVDKENFDASKPITGPFNFEVVSLFYRDTKGKAETLNIIVTALDPKGQKLGEFPVKLEFQPNHDRMRSRTKFNTIALTTSGTYLFQVAVEKEGKTKNDLVAAIPIDIQVTVNETATPQVA